MINRENRAVTQLREWRQLLTSEVGLSVFPHRLLDTVCVCMCTRTQGAQVFVHWTFEAFPLNGRAIVRMSLTLWAVRENNSGGCVAMCPSGSWTSRTTFLLEQFQKVTLRWACSCRPPAIWTESVFLYFPTTTPVNTCEGGRERE